eukprot:COSAG01_NODE_17_length_39991_cov_30.596160_40_plen_61_part_00
MIIAAPSSWALPPFLLEALCAAPLEARLTHRAGQPEQGQAFAAGFCCAHLTVYTTPLRLS